jgi:hypothetical protein
MFADDTKLFITAVRRTLYLAFVRPHLGYATQTWAPQSVELLKQVERTQRRATKFILELPFSSTMDYTTRLQALSLLPICYWHQYLDMVLFYKITHGLVHINASLLPTIRTSRQTRSSTSTSTKYVIPKWKTSTYQRSFFIRSTRIWNLLADLDREWSLGERRDRRQHIKKWNTPTFRSCQIGSAFA